MKVQCAWHEKVFWLVETFLTENLNVLPPFLEYWLRHWLQYTMPKQLLSAHILNFSTSFLPQILPCLKQSDGVREILHALNNFLALNKQIIGIFSI